VILTGPFVGLAMPLVGGVRPFERPLICHRKPFIGIGQSESGFTLIEMVVTIAIAAILVTLALPNFRTLLANNRLATQANEFVADINYAKGEASNRRPINIGVCAGSACGAGSTWESGRAVFADINNNGAFDGADLILRVRDPSAGSNKITPSAGVDVMFFNGDGVRVSSPPANPAGPVTFSMCDSRGASYARAIVVSRTGQARVDAGAIATCP
jgi:type IV fimbrial biogenesis protein FimT